MSTTHMHGRTIPVTIFGQHEERVVDQLVRCAESAEAAVLCGDGHLGYSQPIGGAIAYENHISPSGVGYDIGCGNKAVATSLFYQDIKKDLPRVMDEIARRISFGLGRPNHEKVDDHPSFGVIEKIMRHDDRPVSALYQKARAQIGTVGGGNHYVDLFREGKTDRIWVGVHFGSRGFGHTVASGFLARAVGQAFDARVPEGGMDAPPTLLRTDSPLGHSYIEAMTLAGEYAYAGRDIVVDKVLEILGNPAVIRSVHNHHNYAWHETHGQTECEECTGSGVIEVPTGDGDRDNAECPDCEGKGHVGGKEVWVVRKGCTPAFPGQDGFVGGSMGDISVILRGVDSERSKAALYSTVHGAGRAMSRTQAAGKTKRVFKCTMRDCETWIPTHEYLSRRTEAGLGEHDRFTVCEAHPEGKMKKMPHRISAGAIDYRAVQAELSLRGIELRGGAADEAPGAYKRLPEVLAFHEGTIEIEHTLVPIGVVMAGPGIAADD